ncbi:MAG: hypothetical protein ACN6OC_10860 [Alcaligenes sp.]
MKLNLKLAPVWFVAAASGGAIGGFFGVALASWLTSVPKVLGADWWEAMTAFGTVGAAIAAVWIAGRAESRSERDRRWRATSLKWFLAIKLGDIQSGADGCREELEEFVGRPPGTYIGTSSTFGLQNAMRLLDMTGMGSHLDAIPTLGDDAQRFAKVFALAEARHKEVTRLLEKGIYIVPQNTYLNGLITRFAELQSCCKEVIDLLNKPT